MLGHVNRRGLRDDAASHSWNSAHPSRGSDGGCSQNDLRSTGGDGLFYVLLHNRLDAILIVSNARTMLNRERADEVIGDLFAALHFVRFWHKADITQW